MLTVTSRFLTIFMWIAAALPACVSAVAESAVPSAGLMGVLSDDQWKVIDERVDSALHWIGEHQEIDGSFQASPNCQPAVTGFCVLAFLSHGHLPGRGPYGEPLRRAVDYILSCQREDGIFSAVEPKHRPGGESDPGHNAIYNHAIAAVTLSDLYGMTENESGGDIARAVRRGLELTKRLQDAHKPVKIESGGWRYYIDEKQGMRADLSGTSFRRMWADLSVTSWQLMFYRSARNSGFQVEPGRIDGAVEFVVACHEPSTGRFMYNPKNFSDNDSRTMTASGILALVHSGQLDPDIAARAGRWMLERPYDEYGKGYFFLYSLFYAAPAMYMLGEEYWRQFFPTTVRMLLENQRADGSWKAVEKWDAPYGDVYATSLVVTVLGTPNQLLPIFQR